MSRTATPVAVMGDGAAEARALDLPKYRPDIDGLRAIAVLAVMGFHAFPEAAPGGFTGVDVFFVVSGYLISTIVLENLERGRFSFAVFYARRVRRIFPALAVVLLSALAFGWVALFADELAQLGKHAAAGAGFVSNVVLWGEAGYFDNAADTKPLLHLWSLGVEEQFYLVWPALLWIGWRARSRLAGAIAALGLLSFALCVWLAAHDAVAAFYAPVTRLWELLLGAWLAHRAARRGAAADQPRLADLRAWVGMALIVFGIVAISRESVFPGAWTLAPTLGAFLLVSAGPGAWLNARVLSARLLVGIGLISYPLYLWHWPLLSFARIVEGAPPAAGVRLGALLASVALAWATYAWVERPVRFGARPRAATALACALVLAAGWAGFECFRHAGFPSRQAAQLESLNRFDFSYRQGCEWVAGKASTDDFCNAGNQPSAPPTVLLVGDSFAGAFAPMMDAALRDAPGGPAVFRQIGNGLCPLLLDYGPPACRDFARSAMAYVRGAPSVRLVVLAARWPIYDGRGNPEWGSHVEPPEAFDAAFRRTVAELRAAGKSVAVFLAPPGGSWPKACVVRPLRLAAEDRCELPLAVARHYDGVYRERMLPRLHALSIPYFDPFPYLCGESACRVTDGERVLWADRYHLSAYGAQFLAGAARPQLVEVLRSGR